MENFESENDAAAKAAAFLEAAIAETEPPKSNEPRFAARPEAMESASAEAQLSFYTEPAEKSSRIVAKGSEKATDCGPGDEMYERALALARAGYSVFPIAVGEKKPPIKGWQALATRDPEEIRRLWTAGFWNAAKRNPSISRPQAEAERAERIAKVRAAPPGKLQPYNIGISTSAPLPSGERFFALDFDRKGGEGYAPATVQERRASVVAMVGPLPSTRVGRTASGGVHDLYKCPAAVEVGTRAGLLPGIDTRGVGGYIVAPGSLIEGGGKYEWDDGGELPIAEAPEALLTFCKARPVRTRAERALNEKGEVEVVPWIDYLKTTAPQGGDGLKHNDLYKISMTLGDRGITADFATEVVGGSWNAAASFGDELGYQIETMYASRRSRVGSKVRAPAEWVFGDGSDGAEPSSVRPAAEVAVEAAEATATATVAEVAPEGFSLADYGFTTFAEMKAEPPDCLVKGWMVRGQTSCWFGPPDQGKSAVLLTAALKLASGIQWAGCRTKQGLVIFVAYERADETEARAAAARKKLGLEGDLTFVLLKKPPSIATKTGAKRLVEIIKMAEARYGMPRALVIIDTLTASAPGADLDKSSEMSAHARRIQDVREAAGAHVAIIHHPKKSDPRDARGSGALLGHVDAEINLNKKKITMQKMNGRRKPAPLWFTLEGVPMGVDEDGEVFSVVFANVSPDRVKVEDGDGDDWAIGAPAAEDKPGPEATFGRETQNARVMRVALATLASLDKGETGSRITFDAWRTELEASGEIDTPEGGKRERDKALRPFRKAVQSLVDEKRIDRRAGMVWRTGK
jgi:hypothetical protein